MKCGLEVPFERRGGVAVERGGGGGADGLCGSPTEVQAISVDLPSFGTRPGAVNGERNAGAGEVRDEVGVRDA